MFENDIEVKYEKDNSNHYYFPYIILFFIKM